MKQQGPLSLLVTLALLAFLLLVASRAPVLAGAEEELERGGLPAAQQAPAYQAPKSPTPMVSRAVRNDQSPPLSSISARPRSRPQALELPRLALPGRVEGEKARQWSTDEDSAVQRVHGPASMPSPITSYDGLSYQDNQRVLGSQVMPPDTQGDVGPAHYVQWVNLTFAIWDKAGNLLYGPVGGNTLWAGFGGPCEYTNDGDPITLYDPLADRWLMAQFGLPNYPSGPFYQCIAVSASGDPTGSWYRYAFEWHNGMGQDVMNDYPKFGVWPDGYYMTANQFKFPAGTPAWAGTGVAVLERTAMLQGKPARMVYFDLGTASWGGMLPADFDGSLPPPPNSPNYFVEAHADEWATGLNDELIVHAFHVDWTNPSNSTFTLVATRPTAPFDGDLCHLAQDCITQRGTVQKLDAVADRLMQRLQYRNFSSYATLVTNLTVDANGADQAGLRWFELRWVGSTWSIYQQGTYAPDGDHRWMGSIAMDQAGNIALGYSVSGEDTYPSVRYSGRRATDPLGTLPQAEVELVAGSSYQSGGKRWGDYSMMALDPVDDCTFWYTQEYVSAPGTWGNWSTRIGSFQFPGCSGPSGALEGTVQAANGTSPLVGARVTAKQQRVYVALSQPPNGGYRFEALPAGPYTVTFEAYGYQSEVRSGVVVLPGGTAREDASLLPAASYIVSGTVMDASTGWPLYAGLELEGFPGGVLWTDPVTGYYSASLAAGISYTAQVSAWAEGYNPIDRVLGPLTGNRTENYRLDADWASCIAPGYGRAVAGVFEAFESGSLPPGWTIVDGAGNGQVWVFDDPASRENQTGGSGGFAIVDSDRYGNNGHQDTALVTPPLDLTGLMTVLLQFDTDYNTYTGNDTDDVADVDVSSDGGLTWANVWRRSGASYRGPAQVTVDISPLAAGQEQVLVRFHYHNAFWEWWWQVDNILVGQDLGCRPAAGGLVVGNVFDGNTHAPLVGAQVTGDSGRTALAASTPLDPDRDDAWYVLFSPAGLHTITATMAGGYGPDVEPVLVPEGAVVQKDLALSMGRLAYKPERVNLQVTMGTSATLPLQLSNLGGKALTFEIGEVEVGFEPEGPPQFVAVTIPGAELTYGEGARVAKRRARFRPDITFSVRQVERPAGRVEVLFLTPDVAAGGDIRLIQDTLAAFPDLDVALWDAGLGTPKGANLAAYDVVIVGNDYLWSMAGMDPAAVGDALADYVDAGGAVIDTLFAHDYQGWQLGGRYATEAYAPFVPGTGDRTARPYSLGAVYDPAHPILDGVRAIRDASALGVSHQDLGLAPGATRLADWSGGAVFLAYKDRVVGVNQAWFHGANWSGDVPALMHNILLYLVADDVDWLAVTPVSGTLAASTQQTVTVALDTCAPTVQHTGRYLAKLYLENSTVYANPGVPVTMTVSAEPVCAEVSGVDLTVVNTGSIAAGEPVRFEASILPAEPGAPYHYVVDYGDGTTPLADISRLNPLPLQHTYVQGGAYAVQISVWNCCMQPPEAPSDRVLFTVTDGQERVYLPMVWHGS